MHLMNVNTMHRVLVAELPGNAENATFADLPQIFVLLYFSHITGHNLPDKSCVADTAMQIELA